MSIRPVKRISEARSAIEAENRSLVLFDRGDKVTVQTGDRGVTATAIERALLIVPLWRFEKQTLLRRLASRCRIHG